MIEILVTDLIWKISYLQTVIKCRYFVFAATRVVKK